MGYVAKDMRPQSREAQKMTHTEDKDYEPGGAQVQAGAPLSMGAKPGDQQLQEPVRYKRRKPRKRPARRPSPKTPEDKQIEEEELEQPMTRREWFGGDIA
jgi:hypothetical protein